MDSDFEPPPKKWVILSIMGGVVTGLAFIVGIETLSTHLRQSAVVMQSPPQGSSAIFEPLEKSDIQKIAQLDAQSLSLPGQPIPAAQRAADSTVYVAPNLKPLSAEELAIARSAWQYFQNNWNDKTGLVNSVDGFASVTLWDQSAAIAAIVSARELNLITPAEFEAKVNRMLTTLAVLPLYRQELPNKVYNAKTLAPVNYGKLDQKEEIGWSAIDLGRMAIWLKILAHRYPQFQPQVESVWQHWQTKRLTKNGQMFGTAIVNGKEQYNQEGRLGYESYAAFGLKLWGLNVKKALDTRTNAAFVGLYGQGVPYDQRDASLTGANNYVLSEPYILDGIETGFQALPKSYADRVLSAQEARYLATRQLTALTEDNLDQAPYFVYNTLFVNQRPWATITDTRDRLDNLRFLSTKAAIGWHVLYNTVYTEQLFQFVQTHLKSDKGWYNGFYEASKMPNRALTANNNGVILESLLYKQVGQPLLLWAQQPTAAQKTSPNR